jgi:hypothetical protein
MRSAFSLSATAEQQGDINAPVLVAKFEVYDVYGGEASRPDCCIAIAVQANGLTQCQPDQGVLTD